MTRKFQNFLKYLLSCAHVTVFVFIVGWVTDPELKWWVNACNDPVAVIGAIAVGGYLTHTIRLLWPTPFED